MEEKWLPYVNDPRIEISSKGNVRWREHTRLYVNGDEQHFDAKDISYSLTTGYKYIRIDKKMYKIHRMVAETFLPNPNNLPMVKHKDGNIKNNDIDNLEWTNPFPNIKSVRTPGLAVKSIKDGKEFESIREAANFYGVSYDKLWYVTKHNKPLNDIKLILKNGSIN